MLPGSSPSELLSSESESDRPSLRLGSLQRGGGEKRSGSEALRQEPWGGLEGVPRPLNSPHRGQSWASSPEPGGITSDSCESPPVILDAPQTHSIAPWPHRADRPARAEWSHRTGVGSRGTEEGHDDLGEGCSLWALSCPHLLYPLWVCFPICSQSGPCLTWPSSAACPCPPPLPPPHPRLGPGVHLHGSHWARP